MPRNKVLEKAKVSIPSGRNAFDLSQERAQAALCGEIDVCYAQPFVAGTVGHINRETFTRTADVVSPAFHRVTEHFDFFVVPLHSLWSQWENWKLNINDLKNTLTVPWDSNGNQPDLALPSNAPRMNFNSLGERLGFNPSAGFSTSAAAAAAARKFNDTLRLCDTLRYGSRLAANPIANFPLSKVMSLFMIGAYQKCYFEHYRNTAFEANNPYAYNFDWLYDGVHNGLLAPASTSSTPSNTQDDYVARSLFEMRRVNYRNDYFKNLYPALNYVSNVGGQPVGVWSIPSSVSGAPVNTINNNNQPVVQRYNYQNQNFPSIGSSQTNSANTYYSISTQQIRAIFALDKLMRASAYAPKHVREQYKAQYGVEGVEDFDMCSERIGSFQSNVAFQEVTSMSDTSNASLGALGAKGIGGDGKSKSISFRCKYDSIVIGLHYFLPRARYDNIGVHPWNTKLAREDFYIKAFENLGLRPFLNSYILEDGSATPSMYGWTVPNFEYKILPDLNFGPFKQYFENITFVSDGQTPPTYSLVVTNNAQNELSTFVPHTDQGMPLTLSSIVSAEYFKVRPSDLNNIFVNAVPESHPLNVYQFFSDFRITCAIVAPMGVHGQPSI